MEKEQHSSRYSPKAAALKKSAEYHLENSRKNSDFFRYPRGHNLNLRIISKIQNLIDVFSSKENLIYVPYDSLPEQFEDVLKILAESGIVNAIHSKNTRYNDAPHFSRFGIQSSHAPGSTDGKLFKNIIAGGVERNPEIALSKAVGEFLERYILTVYDKKNFMAGSYREITKSGRKALHPLSVAGFFGDDKSANLKSQHLSGAPLYWEKAIRISTNESYFIPAQLVYWNYRENGEIFLREPNTNGGGGFFTKERALLSGLYELIQRDAFLVYWLNTLSPPKIDAKTVPHEEFQKLVEEAKRYSFAIHCLNTTLDTAIPSFIVVVEDLKKNWPWVVIGGGCEADPAKALYQALLEAWSVYYSMRGKEPFELPQNYKPFADYSVGRQERLRFWGNAEHYDKFAFFLAGEEKNFYDYNFNYPRSFPSDSEELREAIYRVESLGEGYEVLGCMVEHSLLNRLNYFVARAVVPSFVPLYLRESNAPLGAKRLKEVPKKLGILPVKLNLWPHPFP